MRLALVLLLSLSALAQEQAPPAASAPSGQDQPYTLHTQSNIVLVPTAVETKHGEMIYDLKADQFVVEDNGVRQKIQLDEGTDSPGLSLVVLVQCSRSAGWEYPKMEGLGTMIEDLVGDAPHEIAFVTYAGAPMLLNRFSSNPDVIAHGLAQLQPCDDSDAATIDAVDYAARLLDARQNHYRHAILLVSETRDHGSQKKAADVIAALGRTNTVVDSVAFGPGKTEVLNDLKYTGVTSPMSLLLMAVQALRKNTSKQLAAMSGGEYINFTTQKGFDEGLHTLANHVHNYYLLSFTPQGDVRGMHAIRVSVPDYPDARVRFRESYFAGQLDSAEQAIP